MCLYFRICLGSRKQQSETSKAEKPWRVCYRETDFIREYLHVLFNCSEFVKTGNNRNTCKLLVPLHGFYGYRLQYLFSSTQLAVVFLMTLS